MNTWRVTVHHCGEHSLHITVEHILSAPMTAPLTSIMVKMHLLENHMVPFLRQWNGVGFGLMGEQGAESVHAEFTDKVK